jgi:hypothetical protein
MNPWLETIGAIAIALSGILLGRVFSRLRKPYWAVGYFIAAALIALLLLARAHDAMRFWPPFSWFAASRAKFTVLSLAVTMGLMTPLSRLPRRSEKVLVCIAAVVVVTWFSILPFLVPALLRNSLSNLTTMLDSDGICLQATTYTCGPAAAVTALGKLGLPASEGEIAILSHASPVAGTLPICLCSALEDLYEADGLRCQYRHFDSIAEVGEAGIALVVVKDAFLLDHCVAVLEVSDHLISIGDPLAGKRLISHKQFEKIWRFSGIVLKRETAKKFKK